MSTASHAIFTIDEYLKLERAAEFRSEYIQGTMVAMAGAGRNHGRILKEALGRLNEQLRGSPCEVAANDLRLYIGKHNVLTYPDVIVTCGPDVVYEGDPDTIADATLIIEVLSPSTQKYDRGEKFRYYRSLPSFAEYILLSQDTIGAEHYTRQPDGAWLLREIVDPAAVIQLNSIGCTLPLGPLYDRVQFD